MRILITVDPELEIPTKYYGGVERIVQGLIREYLDRDHEIVLLAHTNELLQPGVSAIGWKNRSSRGWINVLANLYTLYKVAIKYKPDIIHSFSRLVFLYPVFILTRYKAVQSYGRHISAKATSMGKRIGKHKLQLTACASHMLNHLPNKEHWKVISNFLELDKFDYKENPEGDYLIFLGRIEDIKGTREAIDVAIQCNQNLLIAGNINPDQQEYYESMIKQFEGHPLINLVGPVDDYQKNELLGNARASILPFKLKEEAFGLTIIESMATGTPVISFNIAAAPWILEHGKTGFLCKDVSEMVQSVSRIKEINRREVRMSIEERFTSKIIASEYMELFSEMQK